MKTCYGGYCYEHKEGEDPGNIVLSSLSSFLIDIVIAVTLFTAVVFLNEVSLSDYLTNGDWINNYLNLDNPSIEYINSDFMP